MAWYAELKRRHWYCINGFDVIRWYKRVLYDEWWNSLSEEDKVKVEEARRKRKEDVDRQAKACLKRLCMMSAMVADLGTPYNKYGDIYDEFGFPRYMD